MPCKMWYFGLLFILMVKNAYQQDTDSQQIVQQIAVMMENRFSVLDIRLNHLASTLFSIKPQEDLYNKLTEKFSVLEQKSLKIESRLTQIESNLAEVKNNQDPIYQEIMKKFSEFGGILNRIETSLGDTEFELTSIKKMTKKIDQKAEAIGNWTDAAQVIQEDTFHNIEDIKKMTKDIDQNAQSIGNWTDANQVIQEDTWQCLEDIKKITENIEQEAEAIGNWTSANQDIQERMKITSFEQINMTSALLENDIKSSMEKINAVITESQKSSVNEIKTSITESHRSSVNDIKTSITESQRSSVKDIKTSITESQMSSVNDIKTSITESQRSSVNDIKTSITESQRSSVNDIKTSITESQESSVNKIKESITESQESSVNKIKESITESTDSVTVKLKSAIINVRCPESEGYFRSKVGNQCFKPFIVSLNWDDAQAHCEKHGMRLARPQDPVWLNTYLNQRYGDKQYYLGARGSGSVFTWRPSGERLSSSDPLWQEDEPGSTGTDACLYLRSNASSMAEQPGRPYREVRCTNSRFYPLCEVILN